MKRAFLFGLARLMRKLDFPGVRRLGIFLGFVMWTCLWKRRAATIERVRLHLGQAIPQTTRAQTSRRRSESGRFRQCLGLLAVCRQLLPSKRWRLAIPTSAADQQHPRQNQASAQQLRQGNRLGQ